MALLKAGGQTRRQRAAPSPGAARRGTPSTFSAVFNGDPAFINALTDTLVITLLRVLIVFPAPVALALLLDSPVDPAAGPFSETGTRKAPVLGTLISGAQNGILAGRKPVSSWTTWSSSGAAAATRSAPSTRNSCSGRTAENARHGPLPCRAGLA